MTGGTSSSGINLFQDPTAQQAGVWTRRDPRRGSQFLGDVMTSRGLGELGAAEKVLQGPLDFFSKLLSGDRQSAMEAEAPAVNSILSQYDSAKRAVSQFAPRGGGTASTLAQAPFKASDAITNLLASVRPEAAQALTQISGLLSSLGLDESSIGISNLQFASGEKDKQEQQRYQHGWDIAKFITSLFLPTGSSQFPSFPQG
jgi:hypothetical protein